MIHARAILPRLLPTLLVLLLVGGCTPAAEEDGPAATEPGKPGASADYQLCRDPRPEVCTREYRPVCADRIGEDDRVEQVTRPNACEACTDPEVRGHRPGTCGTSDEEPAAGRTRIDDAY